MRPRACVPLVLVPLVLAGCGGVGVGVEESSVSRAAVRPAPYSINEAHAEGVLHADEATGCLWIVAPDDTSEVPGTQLLLQGDKYKVDFGSSPAAVLHGDKVVARVGDTVELGGGTSSGAESGVDGCPVTGPIWLGQLLDQ